MTGWAAKKSWFPQVGVRYIFIGEFWFPMSSVWCCVKIHKLMSWNKNIHALLWREKLFENWKKTNTTQVHVSRQDTVFCAHLPWFLPVRGLRCKKHGRGRQITLWSWRQWWKVRMFSWYVYDMLWYDIIWYGCQLVEKLPSWGVRMILWYWRRLKGGKAHLRLNPSTVLVKYQWLPLGCRYLWPH